jgi:hypothetical protein
MPGRTGSAARPIYALRMRVMMMLADSAQEVGGKLYILGGGWNIMGLPPSPTAVVLHIHVPWDRTNEPHTWLLELVDHDSEPVMVPGPAGEQPLRVGGNFEVGRPPGAPSGAEMGVSVAVTIGPLPLPPGGRYVWRLSINDETEDTWRLPFWVQPQPPQPPQLVDEELDEP